MLPNEVFALECRKRYEEQGLIVNKSNGQFAHCPLPNGMGEGGVYLLWGDHQHQGLLQSRDVGRKCYWASDVNKYLDTWPPGCFDLWDIYDEFNKNTEEQKKKISKAMSGENHPQYRKTGKKSHMFGVPKTEETKKKMSEARKGKYAGENNPMHGKFGALHPRSKAVIAIKPDGTKLHFGGVSEAARELGIPQGSLSDRYLNPGKQPKRGKWKGWQFRYA